MQVSTNPTQFIRLDITSLQIKKLPGDSPLSTQSLLAGLAPPPLPPGGADNDPRNLYATIQKDGKDIAKIYCSGGMEHPNSVQTPADLVLDGPTGLSIADARIQQMLALYPGSTINYAQNTRTANTSVTTATLFAAQLAGQ